jgi:hypothetical protein
VNIKFCVFWYPIRSAVENLFLLLHGARLKKAGATQWRSLDGKKFFCHFPNFYKGYTRFPLYFHLNCPEVKNQPTKTMIERRISQRRMTKGRIIEHKINERTMTEGRIWLKVELLKVENNRRSKWPNVEKPESRMTVHRKEMKVENKSMLYF